MNSCSRKSPTTVSSKRRIVSIDSRARLLAFCVPAHVFLRWWVNRPPSGFRPAGTTNAADRGSPSARLAEPENSIRPRSITCTLFASPSATVANCSISSTPTPDSATSRIVGIRRLITTRREPERELVDQHEPRLGDERLGEHEHLLLAARQRARRCVEPLLELGEELERPGEAAGRVLASRARSRRPRGCPPRSAPDSSRRPSGTTATPAWRIRSGRRPREVEVAELAPRRLRAAAPRRRRARGWTCRRRSGPSSAVTSPAGISRLTRRARPAGRRGRR